MNVLATARAQAGARALARAGMTRAFFVPATPAAARSDSVLWRRQPVSSASLALLPRWQTAERRRQGRGMGFLSAGELEQKMGEINELFVEARELIADALDSQGSTYFEDDLDDAQHAVKECVQAYDEMLTQLDEEGKGKVMRMMGMKIEQVPPATEAGTSVRAHIPDWLVAETQLQEAPTDIVLTG